MSAEQTPDIETLADWLGAMPESRNVAYITDEYATVISIDVETLAERFADHLAAAVREAEQRALREAADGLDAYSESVAGLYAGDCTDWLRDRVDRVAEPQHEGGARVHNHPPYRPMCNERQMGDQLRGACLNDDGTDRDESGA